MDFLPTSLNYASNHGISYYDIQRSLSEQVLTNTSDVFQGKS